MIEKLDDARLAQELTTLDGWAVKAGKLHREYRFTDFVSAWSFMSAVALVAERMNHHPEWFNVYHTVRVDLTTHDAGGISMLDIELAKLMNQLAQSQTHSS